MIPVLICPVLNRVDLLRRMLDSVDEFVERLVVVDNTPDHELHVGWPDALYIRPIINLGYPGSINAGIAQTPDAPWWMWASNDIVWGSGDLAEIADIMADGDEPVVVTGDRADGRLLRFSYGAINRATVEAVGLMDEWTYHPIYFDDDDYERRVRLAEVEWIEFNGGIAHGEAGHEGSETIKSDPALRARNLATFRENQMAYERKWGGPPGAETFRTPWNLPVPLSFTRPDPAGRARRAW